MSLRDKILLLVIPSIIFTALLVSFVGWGLLKSSLIDNYYSAQKEQVAALAKNITASFEKINSQELPKNLEASKKSISQLMHTFPFIERYSFTIGDRRKKRRRISFERKNGSIIFLPVPRKYRTADISSGGMFYSPDGRPRIVAPAAGAGDVEYEIDFINLWKYFRPVPDHSTLFITDMKGNLLSHDDETRVIAKSNFSALEVVSMFMKKNIKTEPFLTKDERQQPVFALCFPLMKNFAIFSLTPYEKVLMPAMVVLRKISLLLAVFLIPLIFLCVIFANKITTPLRQLSAAAKKVAGGQLNVAMPAPNTNDELGELADDFRLMTESLRNLQNMRDDLIHMIVHDLKSPLSAIVSSVDYLTSRAGDNLTEKQRNFLTLTQSASRNLMRLIEDMLDVAKLEEGKLKLNKQETEIKTLLGETINSFIPQAEAEGKKIELTGGEIKAFVDAVLIKRVLLNLISNALKHTKIQSGEIYIDLSSDAENFTINVSDNGSGIPEEFKEKIFEKFVQAEGKRAQVRSGAGLGLTFCKMVSEAHGGKIKAESKQDAGSSFILELPLR